MNIAKNIPNILSGYRLVVFPFLLYLISSESENLFAWFISISLITDLLDGLIARTFNLQTSFGARLDSIADITTMIAAVYGIVVFKWDVIAPYKTLFIGFGILYALSMLFGLLKFGQFPSLHLYSFKIMGYIQGGFIFTLFTFGFYKFFFLFAMYWGFLACIEEAIVLMVLKEMKSNARGLYWVLKQKAKP